MEALTKPIEQAEQTEQVEEVADPRTAAANRARLIHGMYSKHTVLPGEDAEEYEALRQDFFDDMQPVGARERALVECVVTTQWQMIRTELRQAGFHEWFLKIKPPRQEGENDRMLLARGYLEDCAQKTSHDRLHREYVRLANLLQKTMRTFDLRVELRRKGLLAQESEQRMGAQIDVRDSKERKLRENADCAESNLSPQPPPPVGESAAGQISAEGETVASASTESEIGHIVDCYEPYGKGKVRVVDPNNMTAWQKHCEDLEAEDDRVRAIMDRVIAKGGKGEGDAEK